MDSNATRHKFGHHLNLGKVPINLIKSLKLLLDEFLDQTLCVPVGEVDLRVELVSILESAGSAECEHDRGQQIHLLHCKECFLEVRLFLPVYALASTCARAGPTTGFHVFGDDFFDRVFFVLYSLRFKVYFFCFSLVFFLHHLLSILLRLVALALLIVFFRIRLVLENAAMLGTVLECSLVNWLVLLFQGNHASIDDRVVLQRHWALLSVLHVNLFLFDTADPLGELKVVGYCGREHDNTDRIRQLDNHFLPNRATLLIVDVMNFIENDPLNVSDTRRVVVQHLLQDFGSHNQA